MPLPTLTTERLILRPFRLTDGQRVRELAGAWEVADTTGHMPHPYPEGAAEEWIRTHTEDAERDESLMLAITLRSSGELMGAIGLTIARASQRAELGYWIGVPYWNRGYMTEAVRAVLEFGFRQLALNRIYASHFPRNPASGRVMQKVGMKYEGTLREHFVRWTDPEDLHYYAILKREWDSMHSPKE